MVKVEDARRLEKQLRHESPLVRRKALARVERLDARLPDAILAVAVDNSWDCPILLGTLLARRKGTALTAETVERVAIGALGEALGDRKRRLRRAAEGALVHGNVPMTAADPFIERWIQDPRRRVRRLAARVGSAWWSMRTNDVALVERVALDREVAYAGIGAAGDLLRRLMRVLETALASRRTRDRAIRALFGLEHLDRLRTGAFRAAAATNPRIRRQALYALKLIHPGGARSIRPLVRRLADPVPDVSAAAQEALQAAEQAIDGRADRFTRLLRAPRPHVRANAVRCIPRVRSEPNMGWSTFVRALEDPSFEVRQAAAQTLRTWYSRLPDEVMTRLQWMLSQPTSPHDRIEAAHAVAQFSDDKREAIAALIVGLDSPDAPARLSASWALCCVAPFAARALPALIRAARRDPDENVRSRALWALAKMGPTARKAVPALEHIARDPLEHIGRFAKEALAKIGAAPARAVRRSARAASRRRPGRRR